MVTTKRSLLISEKEKNNTVLNKKPFLFTPNICFDEKRKGGAGSRSESEPAPNVHALTAPPGGAVSNAHHHTPCGTPPRNCPEARNGVRAGPERVLQPGLHDASLGLDGVLAGVLAEVLADLRGGLIQAGSTEDLVEDALILGRHRAERDGRVGQVELAHDDLLLVERQRHFDRGLGDVAALQGGDQLRIEAFLLDRGEVEGGAGDGVDEVLVDVRLLVLDAALVANLPHSVVDRHVGRDGALRALVLAHERLHILGRVEVDGHGRTEGGESGEDEAVVAVEMKLHRKLPQIGTCPVSIRSRDIASLRTASWCGPHREELVQLKAQKKHSTIPTLPA